VGAATNLQLGPPHPNPLPRPAGGEGIEGDLSKQIVAWEFG